MRSPLSLCLRSPRKGSVTPLAVLSLSLLLGMVALAIDGGTLMEDRRHAQATADAAALAAAADLFANYASNQGIDVKNTAQASALSTAAANGFNNDGAQSIVTINTSPQNYQGGPNVGQPLPAGYVEVIVQYNAGRLFSGVFGSGAIPVRARAVARGQWGPINNQMVSLNETAADAVSVGVGGNGSSNVNINGGLLVNSNSHHAINVASGSSLTASSLTLNSGGGGVLGIVGNVLNVLLGTVGNLLSGLLGGGGGGGSSSSLSSTPGPTIADPLRYLPPPNPSQLGLTVQSSTNLNISSNRNSVTLNPGVYQGGITISNGASVTLTPGIYVIQGGGLQVSGSSTSLMVEGNTSGVMLYNDWQSGSDAVSLQGTGKLDLAPPNSGAYQGLTIFQKRGSLGNPAPALTILGSGNVNITGTIYVAYGDVTLDAVSGNNLAGGQIVADTVNASGNGTFNIDPSGQPTARSRIIGLVE